jgi:hypothetical protein
MSANKQTRRRKGRKRTDAGQEASAPAYDRKRTARHRNAPAPDAPEIRTLSRQAEPTPTAPEPKTALQSKLDTLIGLLADTQPVTSPGIVPDASAAAHLHKEVLWRIASLEAALAVLPSRRQGPDDESLSGLIRLEPLSEEDRRAVENAIAVLKTQPPEPTEPPVEALEAAQLLRAVETRIWSAAPSVQPDPFVSAAVKPAGSEPLSWLPRRIGAVADAAIHWINSLKPPF